MTRDPYVLLAIQAYKQERGRVTMKKLARMLGIGEKAFSKIVRMSVSKRTDS